MNIPSIYERPGAAQRHRTEINHNRAVLEQNLQKCQLAIELPDIEDGGERPRLVFKDQSGIYHRMARQDELGGGDGAHNPLVFYDENKNERGRIYAVDRVSLRSVGFSFEVCNDDLSDWGRLSIDRYAGDSLLPDNIFLAADKKLRLKNAILESPFLYDVNSASDTTYGTKLCAPNVKSGKHSFLVSRTMDYSPDYVSYPNNGCRVLQEAHYDEFVETIKGIINDELRVTHIFSTTVENPVAGKTVPFFYLPGAAGFAVSALTLGTGTVTGDIRIGSSIVDSGGNSVFDPEADKTVSTPYFKTVRPVLPPNTRGCLWLYIEDVTGTPQSVTYNITYTTKL